MFQIDFIRHTSLQVTPDLCYGQSDIQVSDTFSEEADVVYQALREHHYDAVFTSPLSRAEKLCVHCGYDQIAVRDSRVMERNFGEWEMKTWAEVDDLIAGHSNNSLYLDHLGQIIPPGGETVEDFFRRLTDFLYSVQFERYRRVAVFCHGGVINSMRYFQGLIEIGDLFVLVPPYGSITSLKFPYLDEKHWRIEKK